MKKILIVCVLSIFFVSCSGEEKIKTDFKEKKVDKNIALNNNKLIENEIKVKKVDKNIALNNNKLIENEIKVKSMENQFNNLDRDKQIDMVKNIVNCNTFITKNAKRDCFYSKRDIEREKFLKLSESQKLKVDCNQFNKNINVKDYPALGRLYNICIEEKKSILRKIEIDKEFKKINFNSCENIVEKKYFSLSIVEKKQIIENCRLGFVIKNKKNCSSLGNNLEVKKCEEVKKDISEYKNFIEMKKNYIKYNNFDFKKIIEGENK